MKTIYPNQLAAALKALPPVVLLWGDDAGALRQAQQQVIASTGLDPADPFATDKLTLADLAAAPGRLLESAHTLSFTTPQKLILINGLSGEEKAEQIALLTDEVKTALAQPLPAVTIVLSVPKQLRPESPLVKAVVNHPQALSVRFFEDSTRDLTGFLQTEAERLGQRFAPDALALMAAGLGADREIARHELAKLVAYAGSETPLTVAHVSASLAGALAVGVFRLTEAVASQNPTLTDTLLDELIQQGEDLTGPFSATLSHLKTVAQAQAAKQAGENDETILLKSGKAKSPPAARQAFLHAVQRYPKARLSTLPAYAVETLSQARSGLLPGNLVLARALLALAS